MKYPEQESSTLEFKKEIPKNDQIIKTIIGFCNVNGGKLIVGVEKDGKIEGIDSEKIQEMMEYMNKSIFEASSPPIIPFVYSQRIGDKQVLVIQVSSGMNKPYYKKSEGLSQGTYIRLGRSTIKATEDIIDDLKLQSKGVTFDMKPTYHAKPKEIDNSKVLSFFSSKKGFAVNKISQEILSSYHLVKEEHSFLYPTVSGILLFGKDPQKFYNESFILCSHFSGISGRKALATTSCKGTLFEQFDCAYNFIVDRLYRSFEIKGVKREEKLEIPEVAIREVLLNAIVHRNYHINAPIKIAIYDNRLEIFSPGVFPGPLDTKNLKKGLTYIRNMVICRIFFEAGYIEKLGSGFITLFESYEENLLVEPKIIEGENFIKCILPRESFEKIDSYESDDDKQILALFNIAKEITIQDVINILNISRATAGRRLLKLCKKGSLKIIGKGKSSRYEKI